MNGARILLVEDETAIREGVTELFSMHEFQVDAVGDGASALERAARGGYALIVLDLMIPPPSGLEVLTQLRARGDQTPVLVLTARGAETDVVEGLERGADDYVTKPFSVKELVARAKGLMRRAPAASPTGAAPPATRVAIGGAIVDFAQARIEHGEGQRVDLTARETLLLGFLHTNRARIVTRAELLVDVWGYRDGTIKTHTVEVHILKLRRKLAALRGGDRWIETARGIGYRLGVE